ncbi:hypothetical protein [Acidisoma sp. L85]|uniref:hypothetical protein n=1 Tax=Acidisoma sp. L85 TaxID=1641850 RepID=UPI00131BFB3C|nr:hypothetical protein [Acidisoma sp. L85]
MNWKLLKGSHEFPGPDGGTCINEAAVVAAGLPYRLIERPDDCPPCFSRVLASYAIQLNDGMDNDIRQELLIPFVVRMANTADVEAVERRRAAYMLVEYVRRILSILQEADGYFDIAKQCRAVVEVADCFDLLESMKAVSPSAADICSVYVDVNIPKMARRPEFMAMAAGKAVTSATLQCKQWKKEFFSIACRILDEAIRLGNHGPLDAEVAVERLKAAMLDASDLVGVGVTEKAA